MRLGHVRKDANCFGKDDTRKIVVTGFLAILALSSSGQVMEHHAHSDAHEKKLLQHSVIRAVTCTGPTSSNPRSYWLDE